MAGRSNVGALVAPVEGVDTPVAIALRTAEMPAGAQIDRGGSLHAEKHRRLAA